MRSAESRALDLVLTAGSGGLRQVGGDASDRRAPSGVPVLRLAPDGGGVTGLPQGHRRLSLSRAFIRTAQRRAIEVYQAISGEASPPSLIRINIYSWLVCQSMVK